MLKVQLASCRPAMRRRVTLLYGIVLVLVIHLVVLAILNHNLALTGDGQVAKREVSSWVARNMRAQRTGEEQPELEVQARQLPSLSHGSSGTVRPTLGSIGNINTLQTSTNKAVAASSNRAPASAHRGSEKMATASESITTGSVLKKGSDVDESMISSDRWRRLKPPSMLLDSKEGWERVELQAEAERRDTWLKELRRRSALAELEVEEEGGPAAVGGRNKAVQELTSGKPEEAKKPGDAMVEKRGGLAKGDQSQVLRAFMADALVEEHKRAEELNEKWKKRKQKLEKGKKLEEGDYGVTGDESSKLTVGEYFREVCENTAGPLVECSKAPPRNLSSFEASGGDILLTLRTTVKYHDTRLPVLFDTWLGEVEPTNVFIVTDGEDEDLLWKTNTLGKYLVYALLFTSLRKSEWKFHERTTIFS